ERHGVKYGHGNPMRRAAEKPYVMGLSQIGIRNVSSTARDGYEDARKMGSDILSVRQFRKLGVDGVLSRIPKAERYYLTIDIDGFDPSIAAGTGTPSHGGFLYYEKAVALCGADDVKSERVPGSSWFTRVAIRPIVLSFRAIFISATSAANISSVG
ncbi:arginase family protein, partial [Alphaproteobacteria bacterium]|nr:arginase family protein [Alphaproteobacteria bacterium]